MTAAAQTDSKTMISKLLNDAGIKKAAIVDDAYDIPTVERFDSDQIGNFWGTIQRDDEMRQELIEFCPGDIEVEDVQENDIDDDCLRALWEKREDLNKLKTPVKDVLFADKLQKIQPTENIKNHLENLGLEVRRYGSEGVPVGSEINIVFLDYIMDEVTFDESKIDALEKAAKGAIEKAKEEAIEKATKIAMQLYKENECFIVLMSSRPNVEKENFRNKASLLQGLFDFVHKKKLEDELPLHLKLETWARGLRHGHKIQNFVEALEKSYEETHKAFQNKIRGLSLADYAFVSRSSLETEGQPLGDYMLSLYGAFTAHILRNTEAVKEHRAKLDELIFDQSLPFGEPPSSLLVEMYKIVVSDPEPGVVGPHPHFGSKPQKGSRLLLLHMGDIFFKDVKSDVFMVINAACDLAFSPNTPGRAPDPERSIHFIPGCLQLYEKSINNQTLAHTGPFGYNGNSYRIIWDHKRVFTKRLKDVKGWLKRKNYPLNLLARLRFPFALQVQQCFTANLNRAGVPVSPPICEVVDIEIFYKGNDGNTKALGEPIKQGAFLSCRMEADNSEIKVVRELCFNGDFVIDLRQALKGVTGAKKRDALNKLRNDSEYWFGLKNKKFELNAPPKVTSLKDCKIDLHCNNSLNGKWNDTGALIALNFIDGNEPPADSEQ